MEIIKSISNGKVQEIKQLLSDKSYRSSNGAFIIEGINVVRDCPKNRIICYYVAESCVAKFNNITDGVECHVLDDKLFARVLDTKSPQGIAAKCSMDISTLDAGKFTVIADNISDPTNMATILRTMAACGVTNLVLHGDCCDIYSPKVARASMGGIFHVKFACSNDAILSSFDMLYLLDMAGVNIYNREDRDININRNIALVVGSEASGIASEIYSYNHIVLSLPMSAGAMESLNAGVSLSIALYELMHGSM